MDLGSVSAACAYVVHWHAVKERVLGTMSILVGLRISAACLAREEGTHSPSHAPHTGTPHTDISFFIGGGQQPHVHQPVQPGKPGKNS